LINTVYKQSARLHSRKDYQSKLLTMLSCIRVLLWILFLGLLVSGDAATPVRLRSLNRLKPKATVASLVTAGHQLYKAHRFSEASVYYSALLQILEGSTQVSDVLVKQLCGVRLADCELRDGACVRAIARCSEVVAEMPEEPTTLEPGQTYSLAALEANPFFDSPNDSSTLYRLGLAHLTRAKAFAALNMTNLAAKDLKCARKYLPDEQEVYQLLEKVAPNSTAANSPDDVDEQIASFAEECMLSYPSAQFTKAQLGKLYSIARRGNEVAAQPTLLPNVRQDAGNTEAMAAIAAPAIARLLGMDSAGTRHLSDVTKAVAKAWRGWKRIYSALQKHSTGVVTVLTALWVVVTASGAGQLYSKY
jgi:hypothetical protein